MSEQSTLPFEPITDVATRDTSRLALKRAGEIFKIDINKVKIREGLNSRYRPAWMDFDTYFNKKLAIPELAAQLKARGQEEPIEGDLMPDGNTFYVTEGHRRTMAMQYLIEHDPEGAAQFQEEFKGETLHMITVVRYPAGMTEIQRLLRTSTQDKLKLEPLEMAYRVMLIKQNKEGGGEYTNDELAELYGKSRQWVDNQIHLATLPEDLRIQIEKGELSPTQALAVKREEKKVEREGKKRSIPADKEDEDGYIVTKGAKGSVEDISKSFLGAAHWDDERRKVMNHVGIADFDHFTDWNHAFVRGIKLMNSEYQTSIKDYINDFKVWFGDQNAEDPTELHKDEEVATEPPTSPAVEAEGNHDEMGRIPGQAGYGEAPAIHDTASINNQDDGLLKGTDPNFKDPRPIKDRDGDALGKIDFKKEKTEAEMELNEIKGMVDKINVRMDSLPAAQKQMAEDMQRLCAIIQKKIEFVQTVIKKASDER